MWDFTPKKTKIRVSMRVDGDAWKELGDIAKKKGVPRQRVLDLIFDKFISSIRGD